MTKFTCLVAGLLTIVMVVVSFPNTSHASLMVARGGSSLGHFWICTSEIGIFDSYHSYFKEQKDQVKNGTWLFQPTPKVEQNKQAPFRGDWGLRYRRKTAEDPSQDMQMVFAPHA